MRAARSKDELYAYVRSLNTEISRIWEHWSVLKGVHQAANEYGLEMNESGQYWRISSRALQDVVIVRLAAAVDPADDVVSMPKLLRLLQHQLDRKTSFLTIRQRDLLHCADIDLDIDETDTEEPTIKKVRKLRNKVVAHRDMSTVVNDALHEFPELPDTEIEGLITKLSDMVFKYCRAIGMTPIILGFPGDDDYKSLFKLLRSGFKAEYDSPD